MVYLIEEYDAINDETTTKDAITTNCYKRVALCLFVAHYSKISEGLFIKEMESIV